MDDNDSDCLDYDSCMDDDDLDCPDYNIAAFGSIQFSTICRDSIAMFLVVFVYVHWKPQHQNKFLVCASTLGNKALVLCFIYLFIQSFREKKVLLAE